MSMDQYCYAKGSDEPSEPKVHSLRLYNMPFCPSAYRVRMVLAAKCVPYEVVNIDLSSKPDWFLAKNPSGLVPALQLDGHVITESLVLSDFVDSAYGGGHDSLWSTDALQKAKEKLLLDRATKLGELNAKVYGRKNTAALEEFLDELPYYENNLNLKGAPFFSGRQEAGMVDYMMWPFFKTAIFLWSLDLYQGKRALLSPSERPLLTAWILRMREECVCRNAYPADELSLRFWRSMLEGRPQFHLGLQRLPPSENSANSQA